MRLSLLIFLVAFTAGCSTTQRDENVAMIHGEFGLSFEPSFLSGAKIFSIDSGQITIAKDSGISVSGLLINGIQDDFPESMDFRKYPKYLLGTEPLSGLKRAIAKKFESTANTMDILYGIKTGNTWNIDDMTIYSSCLNGSCLAYIVKDDIKDHLLSVYAAGFEKPIFDSLIRKSLYVK